MLICRSESLANMSKHPNYTYPQLVEVLCEIHYSISKENPWKPTAPGLLFKRVQADYPELEPINEQGIILTIGPDGVPTQQVAPPKIKFKLSHGTKPFLVQISPITFTLNALSPYPGWKQFKAELSARWADFVETVKPAAVTRVGLRYINRIKRLKTDETPGFWFTESPYIANAALQSGRGFLSRLETRIAPEDRLLVTLAHDQNPDPTAPQGTILLDIDRIVEKKFEPTWKALETETEKLHESAWDVFEQLRGPNLETLLTKGKVDA